MALFKNKPFIFALLWMGLFAWTTVSEACYFPDGIQAMDNTPCYKNGTVSVCCGPGFTCLSNGLCQQGQNLFRGTCTDSTWKSDACPSFCKSGRQLDNWMSSCPSLGSGHFCCGSDNSCCKNSTLILDLGSGTVISSAFSTSTSTSTTTSTSTSTFVSRSSIQTAETTTAASKQSTSTIASSQTTTTSNITPSVQVDENNGPGTNTAVVAGISVGVGIPVCAGIAAFIFFFCRRRRRQVASDEFVSDFKSRELLPPAELELNPPGSEIASTAIYELPATRGSFLSNKI